MTCVRSGGEEGVEGILQRNRGNNEQIDSKALPRAIGLSRIHLQQTHDSAQRPAQASPRELLGLLCRVDSGVEITKVGRRLCQSNLIVWAKSIFHTFLHDRFTTTSTLHNSTMNRLAPVLYIRSTLASSRANLSATQVRRISRGTSLTDGLTESHSVPDLQES